MSSLSYYFFKDKYAVDVTIDLDVLKIRTVSEATMVNSVVILDNHVLNVNLLFSCNEWIEGICG